MCMLGIPLITTFCLDRVLDGTNPSTSTYHLLFLVYGSFTSSSYSFQFTGLGGIHMCLCVSILCISHKCYSITIQSLFNLFNHYSIVIQSKFEIMLFICAYVLVFYASVISQW
jgi:hypothetical protein